MNNMLINATSLRNSVLIILMSVLSLLTSTICLAEDTTRKSTSHHQFEHASLEYRSPLKEGFKGAFFGGAIGLGSGLAIAGVHTSYGGEGKYNGRIISPFFAAGIIGGALYGVWNAYDINNKSEERENKMIERFGRVAPTIYQTADNGTGYGLAFSWKLN